MSPAADGAVGADVGLVRCFVCREPALVAPGDPQAHAPCVARLPGCRTCEGSGESDGRTCPECNGAGRARARAATPPDGAATEADITW